MGDLVQDFDEYVRVRGKALLRFAYVLSGDRHLAEDLVQEVLAKAHPRWSRITRLNQPESYLRKAILHQFLSWRRRRSSGESVMAEPPEGSAPRDHAADHVERDAVWALLATLPRQQRAAVVLRFYEDLDDDAIAGLIGCSAVTVRTHVSRALASLRISVPVLLHGGDR